jgi:16S rRNA (cytidine1402-2'-O)-methyltransferase
MLYFVPTPIGNLADLTFRAVDILRSVDYILAEDTRLSGKLLKHYNIETSLRSFHIFNEHRALESIVEDLKTGIDIALISDAGTPGISDPGFLLSRACRQHDIQISCLPGASALIPALVMSGLPAEPFHFEGFLPKKKGRKTRLEYLSALPHTFLIYESPYRLLKCLKELEIVCGSDRPATVLREISKIHETADHGTLNHLIEEYSQVVKVKGEIVIVVGGK